MSAATATATAESSSPDANQSSQNEVKANGMPCASNDEMKIESTMDNEESVQLAQDQQKENRTNAPLSDANGKPEDQVNVRQDEKEDVKNGEEEAQCDSVRPDAGGVGVDSVVDGDVRQVNGGKTEKCNEIDMNDSNCDSSDNLNADACRQHRTETTETTSAVAVTVKNESESKASVNCTNESNNNDIIDAPKIECSEMGGLVATKSESNENSIKSSPTVSASTTTTTTSDALDVKNDSMRSHELQAMDKGGGGRRDGTMEVPRNAISVIAESKIKKTCDLFDEHTRVNGPEHNSITSSVVEMATATAMADKRKHSNDNVIESTAKLYERKVIVSPPKSSLYHQSQPVVVEQKSRPTSSLYVNVPDFTKQMHTTPPPPPTSTAAAAAPSTASSLRDLSPLRMKPPDFSKLCRTSELHVTNPDFTRAYNRVVDARPKARALTEVNASNFAEISKKYNYVSDLQLKNPLPVATTSSSPAPAPSAPPSMYVRPPDFSSSKVRSRMENESNVEEPAAHVIRKPKFRIQADSSSKSSTTAPATPVHNEFPQISHDVTMSLVSPHRPQQVMLCSCKIIVCPYTSGDNLAKTCFQTWKI